MWGHPAVSVDDNFAPGDASIAMRSAGNKPASRIDVNVCICVHQFCRHNRIDYFTFDVLAQLFSRNFVTVLTLNYDGIDAFWRITVVFNGHL